MKRYPKERKYQHGKNHLKYQVEVIMGTTFCRSAGLKMNNVIVDLCR